MTRIVAAELLKVVTTRVLLWIGLIMLGFVTLVVLLQALGGSELDLGTLDTQRAILQTAGLATVFAAVLGVLVTCAEYAHGTITHSFLAVPARERVLAAKLLAGASFGLLLAVLADAFVLLLAELSLNARGFHLQLEERSVQDVLFGVLVAGMLAGALGVGLGALVRRQSAAITLLLSWLLIGENIVAIVRDVARYAPGHAFAAVVSGGGGGEQVLGMWTGAGVALCYAIALGLAGGVALIRRDVG